jgi:hypothetical protein
MTVIEHDQVTSSFEPIRQTLDADGYALVVESVGETSVNVRVDATPSACEECLVPKDVMATILTQALTTAGLDGLELSIAYPGE